MYIYVYIYIHTYLQYKGQYAPEEAVRNRGFFDLSGTDPLDRDFNFKEEIHKAIGRHRRYDKPDTMAASEKVDDELEVDDDEKNNDHDKGDGAAVGEEDRRVAGRPISTHLKPRSALSIIEQGKQTRSRRRSVNNQPLMLDELLHNKISSKKYKVMAKSIVLARQDMIAIENNDDDVTVDSNNRRSSSSNRRKDVVSSAATNNETVAPSMKIWPLNLTRWWLEMGRHVPKGSSSVIVPTTSAHNINMAVLALRSVCNTKSDLESSMNDIDIIPLSNAGSNSTTTTEDRSKTTRFYEEASSSSTNVKSMMSSNSSNSSSNGGGVKEEDDDKLSKKSKLGHLSWYYSPVSVCDRCSKVYAELDRLRNMKNKHLVQKQKELLDLEDEKNNRWKEVEVRLT